MMDQEQALETVTVTTTEAPAAGEMSQTPPPEAPIVTLAKDVDDRFQKRFSVHEIDEKWRKGNLPGRVCYGCGSPKCVEQIIVFMPAKEFVKRAPQVAAVIAAKNDGRLPCARMKDGPYVSVSDVTTCSHCQKDARKAAATAPSFAIVEFRNAPKHSVKVAVNGFKR